MKVLYTDSQAKNAQQVLKYLSQKLRFCIDPTCNKFYKDTNFRDKNFTGACKDFEYIFNKDIFKKSLDKQEALLKALDLAAVKFEENIYNLETQLGFNVSKSKPERCITSIDKPFRSFNIKSLMPLENLVGRMTRVDVYDDILKTLMGFRNRDDISQNDFTGMATNAKNITEVIHQQWDQIEKDPEFNNKSFVLLESRHKLQSYEFQAQQKVSLGAAKYADFLAYLFYQRSLIYNMVIPTGSVFFNVETGIETYVHYTQQNKPQLMHCGTGTTYRVYPTGVHFGIVL